MQPGASRERIVGVMGDAVRIAVTVPPEKGKANKAAAKLIAGQFGLPASAVTVVAGAGSRRKTFRIHGVSDKQVRAWVERVQA